VLGGRPRWNRQATGAHVGIADGLDLLDAALVMMPSKALKQVFSSSTSSCGVQLLADASVKPLKSVKRMVTLSKCLASAWPGAFSSSATSSGRMLSSSSSLRCPGEAHRCIRSSSAGTASHAAFGVVPSTFTTSTSRALSAQDVAQAQRRVAQPRGKRASALVHMEIGDQQALVLQHHTAAPVPVQAIRAYALHPGHRAAHLLVDLHAVVLRARAVQERSREHQSGYRYAPLHNSLFFRARPTACNVSNNLVISSNRFFVRLPPALSWVEGRSARRFPPRLRVRSVIPALR
jgi:hypothetical protein